LFYIFIQSRYTCKQLQIPEYGGPCQDSSSGQCSRKEASNGAVGNARADFGEFTPDNYPQPGTPEFNGLPAKKRKQILHLIKSIKQNAKRPGSQNAKQGFRFVQAQPQPVEAADAALPMPAPAEDPDQAPAANPLPETTPEPIPLPGTVEFMNLPGKKRQEIMKAMRFKNKFQTPADWGTLSAKQKKERLRAHSQNVRG